MPVSVLFGWVIVCKMVARLANLTTVKEKYNFDNSAVGRGLGKANVKSGMNKFWAGVTAVGITCAVQAAPTLTIFDGVNPLVTIVDGSAADYNSFAGAVLAVTNVGVWNLVITSGATKPVFGSATNPLMDLAIQASSSAAGSLTVTFSDNNFGPATGTLNASISGVVYAGASETVDYQVYGSAGNAVGSTTTLLANVGTALPIPLVANASGPLTLANPYSLTQVVKLTSFGASSDSMDASFNVTPVPEPGMFALPGLGLALWAARSARRKLTKN